MMLLMKINNKGCFRLAILVFLGIACNCSFASDNVDYIREMFSRESIQSDKLLCENKKGVEILSESNTIPNYYGQERNEIETIVLSAIHKFEIKVDVNGEPCLIKDEVLSDRGAIFNCTLYQSKILNNDKEELIKLVAYVGTIKKSSMPTNLTRRFFTIGPSRIKDEEAAKRYSNERAKQQKTQLKNRAIEKYRERIIDICSKAMPSWKKKMSEDEFNAFVSKLEELGKMNDLEKAVLERHVISKDEWTKRVDAWWASPLEKREAM